MRYFRYALLLALAVCLVVVAVANRGEVTLQLLPVEMAGFLGWSWAIRLPLFIVIFAAILGGVMIGFVWEWLREHKFRADAARQRREKEQLQREMSQMRGPSTRKGDDVLALLEPPPAPR